MMSYSRISREEAQAMIDELKAQNVRSAEIRNRMVDEGFSFAEIYEMLGEEQYATNQARSPYSKFKSGDNFSYPEPTRNNSPLSGPRVTARAIRYVAFIIIGIFGLFSAFFNPDTTPVWAYCALPLVSLYGFVRLWMLFD